MAKYKLVGCENPRTGEESVWVSRDGESMSPEDIVDDLQYLQEEVKRLTLIVMDLKELAVENEQVYVDDNDELRFTDSGDLVGQEEAH